MTMPDLYQYIVNMYGTRLICISDIAKDLGITYIEANHLTFVLGYRNGKATALVPLKVFAADPEVKRIQAKIKI